MRSDRQVIEIVGVAGAGKSTLAHRLSAEPGRYLAPFLDTRRRRHRRYIWRSLPAVAPVLMRGAWNRPRISWRELKLVVYVASWPRYLSESWEPGQTGFVLDQGPVYALGRLRALGKPFTQTPSFERWKHKMVGVWSRVLSHVVVLDAPDQTLIKRIGARADQHEAKGLPSELGIEFLRRHRRAFEEIIGLVELAGGPTCLRVDSGLASAEELAMGVSKQVLKSTNSRTARGD